MVIELAVGLLLAQAATGTPDAAGPPAGGQAEYERSYIGFDELAAVSHHGAVLQWTLPYQGKYRRPLEGDELYRLLGRDDLVARYRENQEKRASFQLVGLGIAIGAPLIALATRSQQDCGAMPSGANPSFPTLSQQWFDCNAGNASANSRAASLAMGGVLVGLLVAGWGTSSTPLQPVDAPEARRLGDEYNQRLRSRLGLTAAPPPERPADGPRFAISLGPVPGGGSMGLAVTF